MTEMCMIFPSNAYTVYGDNAHHRCSKSNTVTKIAKFSNLVIVFGLSGVHASDVQAT